MSQFKIVQIGNVVLNFSRQNLTDTTQYSTVAEGESVLNSPNYFFTSRRYIFTEREYNLVGTLATTNRLDAQRTETRLKGMVGGIFDIIAYVIPIFECETDILWFESSCIIKSVNVNYESDAFQPPEIELTISVTKNWQPLNRFIYNYGSYSSYTTTDFDPLGFSDSFYNKLLSEGFAEPYSDYAIPSDITNETVLTNGERFTYILPTAGQTVGNNEFQGFAKRRITDKYKYLYTNRLLQFARHFYTDYNENNNHYFEFFVDNPYNPPTVPTPTSETFQKTIYINENIYNGLPNVVCKIYGVISSVGTFPNVRSPQGLIRITNDYYDESGAYKKYVTEIDLTSIRDSFNSYISDNNPNNGWTDQYVLFGNFRFTDEDENINFGTDVIFRPGKRLYTYRAVGYEYPSTGDARVNVYPKIDYSGFWPCFLLNGENNLTIEFIDIVTTTRPIKLAISAIPTVV